MIIGRRQDERHSSRRKLRQFWERLVVGATALVRRRIDELIDISGKVDDGFLFVLVVAIQEYTGHVMLILANRL